jgi:hypothetical protein
MRLVATHKAVVRLVRQAQLRLVLITVLIRKQKHILRALM